MDSFRREPIPERRADGSRPRRVRASTRSTRHDAGLWQVDPVLANVSKHDVTRMPHEVVRLAEDPACALMATMPSPADLEHPEVGEPLRRAVGSPERARLLRLVEYTTYGSGSVPLRIECMHGAGPPQAQGIVTERRTDRQGRVREARRLAGLEPEPVERDGAAE